MAPAVGASHRWPALTYVIEAQWSFFMSDLWTATYRLQLHKDFPLRAAGEILGYLKGLGVSHVYLSPCLQAAPGSQHGYDVTDPTVVNPELGGEIAWREFVGAIRTQGLKILLDIVPNHMSATHHNRWWDDMLAHGPYSQFASHFDVRLAPEAPFRIQLCSLGQPYGDALRAGEFRVVVTEGRARVKYFDNSWPLAPASWGELLRSATNGSTGGASTFSPDCFAQLSVLQGRRNPTDAEREEYKQAVAQAESRLTQAAAAGDNFTAEVAAINADPDRLDSILQQQVFALHSWKLAGELSNYRRFFDVDSLIGVRVELPEVLSQTHSRIREMIANQDVDGLRVDHPDGLRDPERYCRALREMLPDGRIYVEKILDSEEGLPTTWHVDGTVGYDFLAKVNRLWMSDQKLDSLTATYFDFTGQSVNLAAVVRQKKREILAVSFSSDLKRLSDAALTLAQQHWATRDLSPRHLHDAVAAFIVAMPVYRTYRTADTLGENDKRIFTEAVQLARSAAPAVDPAAFDFLLAICTKAQLNPLVATFVAEWQQLAPAVMAKGVEDTTFYCFDRLLSCNEVGASPSLVGISTEAFHEYCHYLSESWPRNQLATSTHDNKRSEDVRTRISVLSEIPDRWAEALAQWSKLTEPCWRNRTPDRHAEYLLYQTLIGAWPIDKDRCWQYMLKASREAKLRTSWHQPNAGYEANIQGFVDGIFANPDFLASLEAFVQPLVLPGRINSLAQTLIKMVVPGVPDFYQGTELWDGSLVDPDNRRPIDYGVRAELLKRCAGLSARATLEEWDSGLPKLWLIWRLLELRRERAADFASSSKYQPLIAHGSRLGNLLAFRRGDQLLAVVPRFTLTVGSDWGDTCLPLPSGLWTNAFTGISHSGTATPAALFADFPVAVLLRENT
jgi:(1->4)-alpha-D-glucan 1-alpha-D-glucosylmutase